MKNVLLIVVLFYLQGCAVLTPPEDWTRKDTIAEVAWQVMNVVDYRQTIDIQNHPNIIEGHWLSHAMLGNNPSSAATAQLHITYGISHYLISKYLPKKWRPYWHGGTIVEKGLTIKNNHELGLK